MCGDVLNKNERCEVNWYFWNSKIPLFMDTLLIASINLKDNGDDADDDDDDDDVDPDYDDDADYDDG